MRSNAVQDVVESPRVIAGGGALEAEMARQLRVWGRKVPGRKQLAIMAFAEALDSIPEALAETSGMDKLDARIELRMASRAQRSLVRSRRGGPNLEHAR